MREEVLAVFYGINSFHFEMSSFEVTDPNGLPNSRWSPVSWWRCIGDTNLRRITNFGLVCHPTNSEAKQVNINFQYRLVGKKAEVDVKRIDLLAWEGANKKATSRKPVDRHPSDMTRFDVYRLQKWTRSSDFEASAAPQERGNTLVRQLPK